MCKLKKRDNIILENVFYVLANVLTLLANNKNNGLAAFLNNYSLAVYIFKSFSITTLTSI